MEQQVKIIYSTDNNMYFYSNKTTKELKMYSEDKIKYDSKKLAMITIDNVDWDKVNFDYEIKVINGKLNFTKKINEVLEKKKELETKLEKAKDLNEIKEIIKELI